MKRLGIILIVAFALSLVSASAVFAKRDEEFNKALRYYSAKKYQEAVKTLEGYVAQKPDPAAYYLMGYSLYKLKRFDEANKYFEEAYAVDPEFSLEKAGLLPKRAAAEVPAKAPAAEQKDQAPAKEAAAQPGAKPAEPQPAGQKPAEPAKPGATPQPAQQKPGEPAKPGAAPQTATAPQTAPAPAAPPAPAPAPSQQAAPQPKPSFPMPQQTPGGPEKQLIAMIMGFLVVILVVAFLAYVYFSLCLFLIAKKLNVQNPWLAFIPIAQIFIFVMCAGKEWWWGLIMLGLAFVSAIPLIGLIFSLAIFGLSIYLWMCITENLGRNKMLGLLMIIPIVNFIFLGILAFSKSESRGFAAEEAA